MHDQRLEVRQPLRRIETVDLGLELPLPVGQQRGRLVLRRVDLARRRDVRPTVVVPLGLPLRRHLRPSVQGPTRVAAKGPAEETGDPAAALQVDDPVGWWTTATVRGEDDGGIGSVLTVRQLLNPAP